MREISVQLYSVREAAAADFAGTIKRIADMGYKCVEPAGFPGSTVEEAAKIFSDLGLQAPSLHGGLPIGENKNKVIDDAKTIGAKYIVTGFGGKDFADMDSVKQCAEKFTEASQNATENGFKMGYHNHYWEMNVIDGQVAYDVFLQNTPEDVLCQLDTYWAKVGGQEPVDLIKKYGTRVKMLHMKDGAGGETAPKDPMVAVGEGIMDFPPIIEAATETELFIVELDRCATDMFEAVKKSYDYLAGIMK